MKNIKQKCGHLHFEIAFTNVEKARLLILDKLITHVESMGLNEVELKMFAEEAGVVETSEMVRLGLFCNKV